MSSDPYIRQMVQEIEAVSDRVLSHLSGFGERSTTRFDDDTILVGKTFYSNEILEYRNRRAAGFMVGEGGVNSHMGPDCPLASVAGGDYRQGVGADSHRGAG